MMDKRNLKVLSQILLCDQRIEIAENMYFIGVSRFFTSDIGIHAYWNQMIIQYTQMNILKWGFSRPVLERSAGFLIKQNEIKKKGKFNY